MYRTPEVLDFWSLLSSHSVEQHNMVEKFSITEHVTFFNDGHIFLVIVSPPIVYWVLQKTYYVKLKMQRLFPIYGLKDIRVKYIVRGHG